MGSINRTRRACDVPVFRASDEFYGRISDLGETRTWKPKLNRKRDVSEWTNGSLMEEKNAVLLTLLSSLAVLGTRFFLAVCGFCC